LETKFLKEAKECGLKTINGLDMLIEQALKTDEIQIIVQVNGKLRGKIKVSANSEKDEILAIARAEDNVSKFLQDKEILKEIFIPNKLINFVVK